LIIAPSRDGFFFYNYLSNKTNKIKYVYASRSALSIASVQNHKDFEVHCEKLKTGSKINVKRFLETQFQMQIDEEFDISVEEAYMKWGENDFWNKINLIEKEVLSLSKQRRKNYLAFLTENECDKAEKIAVIDIVSHGSLVYGLSNLLSTKCDLIAVGTTAVPNQYIPDVSQAKTIFGNINERCGDIIYSLTDLSELHLLLELIYSSTDGQFLYFDEALNKHFLSGSEYDTIILNAVQGELARLLDDDNILTKKVEFSKEFVVACLRMLTKKYSVVSDDIRSRFRFTDPYEKDRYLLDE